MITFSFYLQLFFGIGLVCFQFTNAVWRHQSELINFYGQNNQNKTARTQFESLSRRAKRLVDLLISFVKFSQSCYNALQTNVIKRLSFVIYDSMQWPYMP